MLQEIEEYIDRRLLAGTHTRAGAGIVHVPVPCRSRTSVQQYRLARTPCGACTSYVRAVVQTSRLRPSHPNRLSHNDKADYILYIIRVKGTGLIPTDPSGSLHLDEAGRRSRFGTMHYYAIYASIDASTELPCCKQGGDG